MQVFIAGYPCMRKGGAIQSQDGVILETRMVECIDRIGMSMLLRHRCYIDSTPNIIAANTAMVDEAGVRLIPELVVFPAARALSSARAHPDRLVRSAGHTTRLKFALRDVNVTLMECENCVPGV